MKNLFKKFFKSIAMLLPVLILLPTIALAAPGYGAEITDCVVWREGQGARMPIHCKATAESNRRLYELEVAVDALVAQNTQLQAKINALQGTATAPAPVYNVSNTFDPATLQRVSQLEFKVTTLEKRITAQDGVIATLKATVAKLQKLIQATKKK